jgi:bifunctional aspartokinase / homoserine dehydrogenase 1
MGSQRDVVVHKFGGTSLADAECIRRVAAIVRGRPEAERMVVVSAMGGVTDALLDAVALAGRRDDGYVEVLDGVKQRHHEAIASLVPGAAADGLRGQLDVELGEIAHVLHAATLLGGASHEMAELVSGYGEVWAARLVSAHLESDGVPATWLDAREVVVVDARAVPPVVAWETSRERLAAWRAARPALPPTLVITGYVAGAVDGRATTLGRNGSDFSASIFAALLDAAEVHIWTDVDGVMSANPRLVPEAVTLDAISYDEAMELAYFGAKVIHPSTMAPAVERGLPIFIRNTFRPDLQGTRIHAGTSSGFGVKGLATVEAVALLNVEGTGMIGVPGTAERLFRALRDEGISVVMISQGSSEHSICCAVPEGVAARARAAVERAFFAERHHGQIQKVDLVPACSILAVVGDGMAGVPGVSARFFRALGKANVNVRAIAQGSSERNISVVVDAADTQRALRAAHAGFYLSRQTLSIGLIGAGSVGGTLLRQIGQRSAQLKADSDLDLRVRAIATSRAMLFADRSVDLASWQQEIERAGEPLDLDRLAAHVHADHLPHAVLIDCTASETVARRYGDWLGRGIHVITPNKRAKHGGARVLPQAASGQPVGGRALPVRDDRRRRTAHRADAARPRAHRRRGLRDRGHPLGYAVVAVQCVRRRAPVLGDGRTGARARLHGARPARRPLRHGRRPQDRHSRPRDGPVPRARRRGRAESRSGSAAPRLGGRLPGRAARARRRDGGAAGGRRARRRRPPLRRAGRPRRPRQRRAAPLSPLAPVRAHPAHRQHRALPQPPLRRAPAHRAGSRRGAGGHGRRRLRRPPAPGRLPGSGALIKVSKFDPNKFEFVQIDGVAGSAIRLSIAGGW